MKQGKQEARKIARIEYTIKTTLDGGTVVEKTISKECDLTHPDKIDRKTMKGLLSDIDKYEKALISTRKVAEKELSEAVFASGDVEKSRKRAADSEIGRFCLTIDDDFDTFLMPKQRLVSHSLEELSLTLTTMMSYRDCTSLLNQVMHRDEGEIFHHRTIAGHAESVSKRVSKVLSDTAFSILRANEFDPETAIPLNVEALPPSITKPKVTDISDKQWKAINSDMI